MIMTTNSSDIDNLMISLPITEEIRCIANKFAAQQPTRDKAEQVLLNTIAVSVVNNYLNMINITTDLTNSDSQNPVMQLCSNVADLDIPEVGKLECRPIRLSESSCQIPLEVLDLRLGYLVVQIDDQLRRASILGFAPPVVTEHLAIANLQSLDCLIDRLHESKESMVKNSWTNLGQWFDDIVGAGWQAVEHLLTPEQLDPAYSFRNAESSESNTLESSPSNDSVTRAKVIDLGVRLGNLGVFLVVEISSEANNSFAISLRVYPQAKAIYLPRGLELKVLEMSNQVFLETQARSRDNYIQLKFSGQAGEAFKVEIIFDGLKFSEQFQL